MAFRDTMLRRFNIAFWFAIMAVAPVYGFAPFTRVAPTCRVYPLESKLFGPEDDFNEEIGDIEPLGGDDSGKNMANDFYKELRKREGDPTPPSQNDEVERQDGKNLDSPPSTVLPQQYPERQTVEPWPKRKFTGQRESYYAQDPSGGTNGGGQGRTPRETMMEREYQLAGRAERGIAAQAVLAILALAFYIYVGISGGIVSGRDAQTEDFGGDDEIPFEQVVPVQRDREASVWL